MAISETDQNQVRSRPKHAPPEKVKREDANGADFDVLVPDECSVLHSPMLVGLPMLQDEQHGYAARLPLALELETGEIG